MKTGDELRSLLAAALAKPTKCRCPVACAGPQTGMSGNPVTLSPISRNCPVHASLLFIFNEMAAEDYSDTHP